MKSTQKCNAEEKSSIPFLIQLLHMSVYFATCRFIVSRVAIPNYTETNRMYLASECMNRDDNTMIFIECALVTMQINSFSFYSIILFH